MTTMAYSIGGALLPIAVTLLLGFVGAWRGDFKREDASILNRLVLTYALPLMLFAGTLSTSRANLSQGVPLLIVSCVALVGMYGVVILIMCGNGCHGRRSGAAGAIRPSQGAADPFR